MFQNHFLWKKMFHKSSSTMPSPPLTTTLDDNHIFLPASSTLNNTSNSRASLPPPTTNDSTIKSMSHNTLLPVSTSIDTHTTPSIISASLLEANIQISSPQQTSNNISRSPTWGIKLSHLISLVEKYGDLNITEFCTTFILPITATHKISYAEFLLLSPDTANLVTDVTDTFVSYAWLYVYKDLMMALINIKNATVNRYVWIDLFVVNQHVRDQVNQQQWLETFRGALKTIGTAELVLMPWDKPIPPQRIWCVFEHAIVVQEGLKREFRMTPKDDQEFEKKLKEGWGLRSGLGYDFFMDLCGSVNIVNAVAFKEEDRLAILDIVREIGEAEVNQASLGAVKEWMVDVAQRIAAECGDDTKDAAEVFNAKGWLHYMMGDHNEALVCFTKSLDIRVKVCGLEHEEVAVALNNRADCLNSLGQSEEALSLCDQAIEIWNTLRGSDSSTIATSFSIRTESLLALHRYDEAMDCNNQALAIRTKTLGPEHTDTILSLAWKSNVLQAQGKLEEALVVREQALEINCRVHGEEHVFTAGSFENVARSLVSLRRYEEALDANNHALTIHTKALGINHPTTIGSYSLKCNILMRLGRYNEALIVFDEQMVSLIRVFGKYHIKVAFAIFYRAVCLLHLGRKTEAKLVGHEALHMLEQLLGPNNANTIEVRNWCMEL
jgi:tetratricopeptide (TPR) repeat protein